MIKNLEVLLRKLNLRKSPQKNLIKNKLYRIYDLLYKHFGPQYWWPGETPFEIIIGAILTQSTNWSNVRKAIDNLKDKNLINPHRLNILENKKLAQLIRSSGYYNQKAIKLKNFLSYFIANYEGEIDKIKQKDCNILRDELLLIKGIGKETADSILLYALGKPIFVVDTYMKRILLRHDIIDDSYDYGDIQKVFMDNLENSVTLFNEYHALFVAVGKNYCKKKTALCDECPLKNV